MNQEAKANSLTAANEPVTGSANVPVWMFTLLSILLFAGGMYVETYGGGFDARVYEPFSSITYVQEFQPPSEAGDFVAKGRKVYNNICVGCHQPSGMGTPPNFPPLAGSEWVTAEGPNRMIRIVLHGLSGPITVAGQEYGSTQMTALGSSLSDEDIAAVLTFIRQEWGNKAPPVTVEQVKAVRAATADRPEGLNWFADELLKLPEK